MVSLLGSQPNIITTLSSCFHVQNFSVCRHKKMLRMPHELYFLILTIANLFGCCCWARLTWNTWVHHLWHFLQVVALRYLYNINLVNLLFCVFCRCALQAHGSYFLLPLPADSDESFFCLPICSRQCTSDSPSWLQWQHTFQALRWVSTKRSLYIYICLFGFFSASYTADGILRKHVETDIEMGIDFLKVCEYWWAEWEEFVLLFCFVREEPSQGSTCPLAQWRPWLL